ncbi:hypothetical protein ACFU6S_06305 [Streptomyces sp. NPDC057456]|uniref:hypothetical protein n=1 Tax=Streptomyces sp. NPDC057456 TaxID=3346139 RepID=UPI0036B1DA2E
MSWIVEGDTPIRAASFLTETSRALGEDVALVLAGVRFLPIALPVICFCARRVIRSWRRWAR